MRDVADAVSDVHRQQALGEAVIVVGVTAEAQLSDTGDVVAAFAQSVRPTLDAAIMAIALAEAR